LSCLLNVRCTCFICKRLTCCAAFNRAGRRNSKQFQLQLGPLSTTDCHRLSTCWEAALTNRVNLAAIVVALEDSDMIMQSSFREVILQVKHAPAIEHETPLAAISELHRDRTKLPTRPTDPCCCQGHDTLRNVADHTQEPAAVDCDPYTRR